MAGSLEAAGRGSVPVRQTTTGSDITVFPVAPWGVGSAATSLVNCGSPAEVEDTERAVADSSWPTS